MPKPHFHHAQIVSLLKMNPPKVSRALELLQGIPPGNATIEEEIPAKNSWLVRAAETVSSLFGRLKSSQDAMESIGKNVEQLYQQTADIKTPERLNELTAMLLHEVGQFKKESQNMKKTLANHEESLKKAYDSLVGETPERENAKDPPVAPLPVDEIPATPQSTQPKELAIVAQSFEKLGLMNRASLEEQMTPTLASGQPSALVVIHLENIQEMFTALPSRTAEQLTAMVVEKLKRESGPKDVFGWIAPQWLALQLNNIQLPVAVTMARKITALLAIKAKDQEGKIQQLSVKTAACAPTAGENAAMLLEKGMEALKQAQRPSPEPGKKRRPPRSPT